MGTTRTDLFSDELNHLAEQLKALSHPARLAIVEHLLNQSSCINAGFVELTGLAQSTVTRHLGVLVETGLVSSTCTDGKTSYCIAPEAWRHLEQQLQPLWMRCAASAPDCSS